MAATINQVLGLMPRKKQINHQKIIQQIEQHATPLQPTDNMAEAGRKVLQGEFIKMLGYSIHTVRVTGHQYISSNITNTTHDVWLNPFAHLSLWI